MKFNNLSAAQNTPIDTLSLTIHYSNGTKDYLELRKRDCPIREKMFSSHRNNINMEVYKPKALRLEVFSAMIKNKLIYYGFGDAKLEAYVSSRARTGLTLRFFKDLFDTLDTEEAKCRVK